MSDTPRTDAIRFPSEVLLPASEKHLGYSVKETVRILGDHARQLERELTDARAALADRSEEYVIRQAEAESELIAACEERDRYKASINWLINNCMTGKDIHFALTQKDCPEHLRRRLEGKK